MPWISRAEHDRLLSAIDSAESRAERAESALAAERVANREDARHWASMFLRRMQTFPLPKKLVPDTPAELPLELTPTTEVPGMDAGELEALIATGTAFGHTRADIILELRREQGLE